MFMVENQFLRLPLRVLINLYFQPYIGQETYPNDTFD